MKNVLRHMFILILWFIAFLAFACLFLLLNEIPGLEFPRTAVLPMLELIFLVAGLAFLARGLQTANKKRCLKGSVIAALAVPTFYIAKSVNRGIIARGDTREIGLGDMSTMETITLFAVCAFLIFCLIQYAKFSKKAEYAWEQEKRNVIKTRFVKTDARFETSTSSAIGRAIIGDWVAGPAGAMAGAATAKEKDRSETTFIVYYKDGSSEVKTVRNGTDAYKLYLSRLER